MSTLQASSQAQLRQYIERLERIDEDRKAAVADFKEVMDEAKGTGFDPKIIRKVLKLRQKPKTDRDEEEALLATYCHALGMQESFEFTAPSADEIAEARA